MYGISKLSVDIEELAILSVDIEEFSDIKRGYRGISDIKLDIRSVGDEIVYRKKGNDDWTKAKILSKEGKTSGKNWAYLNIQNKDTDKQSGIDFAKDIEEWHNVNDFDLEEVEVVVIPTIRHNEKKVNQTKQAELDNWQ